MSIPAPDFHVLTLRPHTGQVAARRYQKRSRHSKSSSGCIACKAKRVKCDEAKPCCLRCIRNGTCCTYRPETKNGLEPARKTKDARSAITSRGTRYVHLPFSPNCDSLDPGHQQTTGGGTPGPILIHHFQQIFPELQILGTAHANPVIQLGMSHPFLLDTVMAVSASHLRCHTERKQASRIAEHFRQSRALCNFQAALGQTLDQQLADALLLTSMFLNLLTFSFAEDENPRHSWIFRNDADRLGWFSLNLGLKPLLIATEAYRETSMLRWMYQAADDDQRTFYGEDKSLDHVPQHWIRFLGLDRNPSLDNPLREPARMLAEIKDIEPKGDHFFLYANFIGALDLDNKYQALLECHDERAIWLLGYWMGLMSRYSYWWMRVRAYTEWQASCIWFNLRSIKSRAGSDGQVWVKLMRDLEMANTWQAPSQAASED